MSNKNDYLSRLGRLMKHFDWTQADVAREFRISRGSVSLWFKKEREMSGSAERVVELYEEIIKLKKQIQKLED